jgi:hypothetical protein
MDYLPLITSEHKKPKFQALVGLLTGAIDANAQLIKSMPALFDVDSAIGQQLDYVGQWIGFNRYISPSVDNVFFSLDSATLGLDSGYLSGLYDSAGVTILDDATYRRLLYAKIALNSWDGSIESAVVTLQIAFPDNIIVIQDNNDMTMNIGVLGALSPIIQALLTRGYFDIRPCGVKVGAYIAPGVVDSPFFGLDMQNTIISGLDSGALETILT